MHKLRVLFQGNKFFRKQYHGAAEMAQGVETLATRPELKNQLQQVILQPPPRGFIHVHT